MILLLLFYNPSSISIKWAKLALRNLGIVIPLSVDNIRRNLRFNFNPLLQSRPPPVACNKTRVSHSNSMDCATIWHSLTYPCSVKKETITKYGQFYTQLGLHLISYLSLPLSFPLDTHTLSLEDSGSENEKQLD